MEQILTFNIDINVELLQNTALKAGSISNQEIVALIHYKIILTF